MRNDTADDLNMVAAFLARRGVAAPEKARADVAVVLGNSLPVSVKVACQAQAEWLVCSGGVGHATDDLRNSVRSHIPEVQVQGRSEAAIIHDVARRCGYPADKILLEDRSTNTGENVSFTRKLLESAGIKPRRILVVQDPTMQLRAHATFQKVYEDQPELSIVSFAPFVPRVVQKEDGLEFELQGIEGIWPFERFVSLLLGEIPRLRDYGPHGKRFIAHVEIPAEIAEAQERLEETYPHLARR